MKFSLLNEGAIKGIDSKTKRKFNQQKFLKFNFSFFIEMPAFSCKKNVKKKLIIFNHQRDGNNYICRKVGLNLKLNDFSFLEGNSFSFFCVKTGNLHV